MQVIAWNWMLVALFVGMSGGIVIGVVIDRDTVINQIFKRIRYKKGTGDLVIDGKQNIPEKKTRKERIADRKSEKKQ